MSRISVGILHLIFTRFSRRIALIQNALKICSLSWLSKIARIASSAINKDLNDMSPEWLTQGN